MNKPKSMHGVIIGQFQFILTPVSIWFQGQEKFPPIRMYIQKGMQIIGKVNQPVIYPQNKKTSDRKFYFKNQIMNRKSFRVYNQQNLSYKWSLYQIKDDQTQNFLDSIAFTLDKSWQKYSKWYQNAVIDIGSEIKDGSNEKIAEKWKEIIQSAENKQYKSTVLLQKKKISIQYKLQIKNQFDTILDQYQKQRQRKLRQKQQRMYMRSTLVPNRLLSDPNQIKVNNHNQLIKSQYGMLRTDSNQFHKQINSTKQTTPPPTSIHNRRTSSQKVRFASPQNSSAKSPSKLRIENKQSNQSSQMLKNQSKILCQIKEDNEFHSHQKKTLNNSNKKQKQQQQPIDDDVPLIRLDSNSDKGQKLEEQSRKKISKSSGHNNTPGVASLDQAVGYKKAQQWNIKSIASYLLLSVIMVWMVYELMKPSSKV